MLYLVTMWLTVTRLRMLFFCFVFEVASVDFCSLK